MNLPSEVLKLLGDDATPERAAEKLEASAIRNVTRALQGFSGAEDSQWATKAHWMAISAAAIRECEAARVANDKMMARPIDYAANDAAQLELEKRKDEYDALRNWREHEPERI